MHSSIMFIIAIYFARRFYLHEKLIKLQWHERGCEDGDVAPQTLEEIQGAAFRDKTCEITEQKGILRDYIHFCEHLQSTSEGTLGREFMWKNGTDRQYKRDDSPRIEWPFGSMPNYFLLVKHSTRRGRDEVVKRTQTTSFHSHFTSI